MRPAWLGLSLLLAADAALAQFQPLRFDDDFSAQGRACAGNRDAGACWKDRPVMDDARLSIGGDLRVRHEYARNPRYGLERQDRWGAVPLRG